MRWILAALLTINLWAAQEGGHAAAAPAHGAEAGHAEEHHGDPYIWWKWANFAILATGLGYLIKKNAGPYFAEKNASIAEGISAAEEARRHAEAKSKEVDTRLARLDDELKHLREESQQEILRDAQRIGRETEEQLSKIQHAAEQEITAAGRHAQQDLRRYAAGLALDLAAGRLKSQIDSPADGRLIGAFVADLKKGS